MTERLLKETKISRRNAKAALTRARKSLRHLIEIKRPGKEVRDVLSKVQEAYDKLIENHDKFTKLIEKKTMKSLKNKKRGLRRANICF